MVEVPAATWPISTAVAALAMPGMLWCSASQWARVAQPLGELRQVQRVVERLRGVAAYGDRRKVEYGERDHEGIRRHGSL